MTSEKAKCERCGKRFDRRKVTEGRKAARFCIKCRRIRQSEVGKVGGRNAGLGYKGRGGKTKRCGNCVGTGVDVVAGLIVKCARCDGKGRVKANP